jgi:hypothetical protein
MGDALLQECGQQGTQMIGHVQQGSNDTNQQSSPMKPRSANNHDLEGDWLRMREKRPATNRECAQPRNDQSPTRAKRKMPILFSDLKLKSSPMNLHETQCQYLQMRSLDGFSDLQLGRYCFNLETEFSPKGFETLVSSSQASSKTIFSKMISP